MQDAAWRRHRKAGFSKALLRLGEAEQGMALLCEGKGIAWKREPMRGRGYARRFTAWHCNGLAMRRFASHCGTMQRLS